MSDFLLFILALFDDLARLATSQEFIRVLAGAVLIVGVLVAGATLIVGALALARIGFAAVVRLATRSAR